MKAVRLSVRRITELALRCGDIESRFVEPNVMWNGSAAHRKLQAEICAAMGPDYRKEVKVSLETEVGGIPVELIGRADGAMLADGRLLVDEIKTTTASLARLDAQRELHLGQAICYAHMLICGYDEPPATVAIQLIYYQLNTKEREIRSFDYTPGEIAEYFHGLMERYAVWLRFEQDWKKLRDASIKNTNFPYPAYRKGQRELAVAAYRTIERKRKLYAQAPTGIGKTLSALFPSVKALGEGLAEKIFYLTAKAVTRSVATDAAALMALHGLRLKSVTLRAKEKICFCEETRCSPDHCEFAKGHFDRVNAALLAILKGEDIITPAVVERYARAHRVCPFETALDLTLWADLIIGDYNHVFDPSASLKRFFGEDEPSGEYIFLIDETHNLPDRVREMYSAAVCRAEYARVARELRGKSPATKHLRRALKGVAACFGGLDAALGEDSARVFDAPDRELADCVAAFVSAASDWLAQEASPSLEKAVLELYFSAMHFSFIFQNYDEHYATIVERDAYDLACTLFCLDPSAVTAKRLALARASVLFSATLTPLPYYREILGGGDEDYILALPSPFDPARLTLAAHVGISTKFRERDASVEPIAEAIAMTIDARRGNYIVYFPSYVYMKQVYSAFTVLCPGTATLLQETSMSEDARAAFLEKFDANNTQTLVGFCVLGGSFSEGIDLKGERLVGAVVVGVGLPEISLRSDLIRDYFQRTRGYGFDYAYRFPGMNKILQAAGRVIRSEEDSGTVLLIDARFGEGAYRRLFPEHWAGIAFVHGARDLSRAIRYVGALPRLGIRN